MARFFVGVTGASGHRYAQGLIAALAGAGHDVDLAFTAAGFKVLRHELGIDCGTRGERLAEAVVALVGPEAARRVRVFAEEAIEAPPASGSALTGGVVLCPCSMGTLARVAAGFSSNLIERAADVALKEGRPLVIVPRETPLSALHLANLLTLAELGAAILPAMPGFYHLPKSIDDLVAHLVAKILDRLRIEHAGPRWAGPSEPPGEAPEEIPLRRVR